MRVSNEEYARILELVKQYVVVEVLVLALQADRKRLSEAPLKLKEAWIAVVDRLLLQAAERMRRLKKEMEAHRCRIRETVQKPGYREVTWELKGMEIKDKWLNEWLTMECFAMLDTWFQNHLNK